MKEFIDFLGGQAPYDALSGSDLQSLARTVEVEYFTRGTVVVEQGSPPLDAVRVIRSGEAEVVDLGRVVDVLGVGDTFGHVSVLSGLAPAVSVRALEDLLCYRFPDPRTSVVAPERLQFVTYGRLSTRERLTRADAWGQELSPVSDHMRRPVWCRPDQSVQEVAQLITAAGQSFALVQGRGVVGIVTDQDFRRALGTDPAIAAAPITALATWPARAVEASTVVAEAFLEMVEHGVHHLVVTAGDGGIVGVLRVVDLASAEVREPLVVRAALSRAGSTAAVAEAAGLLPATVVELHRTGVPVMHIASLMAAVLDTVVRRVVELHPAPPGLPEQSWMVLGSLARREPLPRSDVDTALVWADPTPGPVSDPAQALAALSEARLTALERCGLRRCPDGANATNPTFARSQQDWAAVARGWVRQPTQDRALLLTGMLADSRPLTGIALGRSVTDAMLETTRSRDFLAALVRFTLSRRPPLGFVRDLVVEHSGAHRGRLDLKGGGLVPIASLGRWVAVVTGDDRGSTPVRLRRGQAAGLLTDDEADTLVRAFEDVYGLLLELECQSITLDLPTSTWVDPRSLDSLSRRHLRETFRAVGQVQNRLESEWVARLP